MPKRNGNDLGKGIATAGIWIGTAISAVWCGALVVLVAFFAFVATCAVWEN